VKRVYEFKTFWANGKYDHKAHISLNLEGKNVNEILYRRGMSVNAGMKEYMRFMGIRHREERSPEVIDLYNNLYIWCHDKRRIEGFIHKFLVSRISDLSMLERIVER